MSPLFLKVPASTSNLGPGFDCLGLALSAFLEVALSGPTAGDRHVVRREGPFARELPGGRDLLVEAFELAAGRLGVGGRFHFTARCGIPMGRGFGSSGAAAAAGLLLAAELAEGAPDLEELLAWGISLEGHPDNVTAALLGGATLCHPNADGRPAWIRVELHPELGFALAWPPEPLPTAEARAALPADVPHGAATENPRRLALLLHGLRTADARLIRLGGEDRLHVPYRLPLIPGAARAIAAARDAGAHLATISGAGSGLVAIGPRGEMEPIARALEEGLRSEAGGAEARVVEPVHGTPVVEHRDQPGA